MTPTLGGRIQTRLMLVLVVGSAWTAVVSPLLPRPGFATLGMAYRITFEGTATVAAAGVGWELVYHGLQQLRWEKDWPSLLLLVTVTTEGASTWVVMHVLHFIPGTWGASSPILTLFALHFASTWVLVWLVAQGPLRVIVLRWRYEGGQVLGSLTASPSRGQGDDQGEQPARRCRPATQCVGGGRPASWFADTGRPPTRHAASGGPAGSERAPALTLAAGSTWVEGVACSGEHLNHPRALYCRLCGASLRRRRAAPTIGPRPSLGVLVVDDGSLLSLTADHVVGSQPAEDPHVADGRARAIVLAGDPSIAQAHADVKLRGWSVLVRDRGSATGTLVADPSSDHWVRLAPGQARCIAAGTRIRIGARELTFCTHMPEPAPTHSGQSSAAADGRKRLPAPR